MPACLPALLVAFNLRTNDLLFYHNLLKSLRIIIFFLLFISSLCFVCIFECVELNMLLLGTEEFAGCVRGMKQSPLFIHKSCYYLLPLLRWQRQWRKIAVSTATLFICCSFSVYLLILCKWQRIDWTMIFVMFFFYLSFSLFCLGYENPGTKIVDIDETEKRTKNKSETNTQQSSVLQLNF